MAQTKVVATDAVHYFLQLCWLCLSTTSSNYKNPGYAILLPVFTAMSTVFLSSGLTFAPGLLATVQAADPPTLDFFRSLPTVGARGYRSMWAVYCLVLVKRDSRCKLYIGCATNTDGGVKQRISQYDRHDNLPYGVEAAIDEGFTIAHKGLLVQAKRPVPGITLALRAIFLVLETMFSIVFWTMQSRTKDYKMPRLCPWSIEDLDWDGCCTHFSIKEKIHGLGDSLTVEQAVELEVLRAKKAKAMAPIYQGMLAPSNTPFPLSRS